MSLTARVNRFFLAYLAVVLLVATAAVFLAARVAGRRLIHERLGATLETLVAAIEVHPTGLEWEPAERRIRVGIEESDDAVRWMLATAEGRVLATSPNYGEGIEGPNWSRREQVLDAPDPARTPSPNEYRRLVLTAAVRRTPIVDATVAATAAAGGVAVVLWGVAAMAGSWYCRRALRPVADMAAAAEAMSADRLADRFPDPQTRDELARLTTSFNGLLDRVERAYVKQQRFAAEASHQLRTPLAAMMGQMEVALRRVRDASEYRRALETGLESARQLQGIVETLLILTRPPEEILHRQFEEIMPNSWADEQRRRMESHSRARDVSFVVQGQDPFLTHAPLLATIFDNLLDNAMKYSPPGTAITVRVGSVKGRPFLEVADRGAGVAADDLPRLHEPFFRSADARRKGIPGAGLGLAIVANCAAVLGLTLSVFPRESGGTMFRVSDSQSLDSREGLLQRAQENRQ